MGTLLVHTYLREYRALVVETPLPTRGIRQDTLNDIRLVLHNKTNNLNRHDDHSGLTSGYSDLDIIPFGKIDELTPNRIISFG
jgi:hypothetical protein